MQKEKRKFYQERLLLMVACSVAVSSFCPTKNSADDIKCFLITRRWNVVRIKVADNCGVYRNYLIVEPLPLIYFFVVSRSCCGGRDGRKEKRCSWVELLIQLQIKKTVNWIGLIKMKWKWNDFWYHITKVASYH